MEEIINGKSQDRPIIFFNHNGKLLNILNSVLELNNDPAVESKIKESIQMITSLKIYVQNHSTQLTPLAQRIEDDTLAEPWSEHKKNKIILFGYITDMMSSVVAAQFIRTIAEISKAERILEIGLFTGLSAAIFCSSEFVKQVTSLEIDPFLINFVKIRFAGTDEEKKLRIVEGSALESLKKLKSDNESFDLVFIDADKSNYLEYYKFVMDNDMISSGGVILVDNTLWQAEPYSNQPPSFDNSGENMKEFNRYVFEDERVTKVILPFDDGLTFVRRK